jgi:probable HAF family extracellular repeat protein
VAVRWYGQHLRELGPGDALAIDAAGVTVGADAIPAQAGCTITNWFSSDHTGTTYCPAVPHAVAWDSAGRRIALAPDYPRSVAYAISDGGTVVGTLDDKKGRHFAFRWRAGRLQRLDDLPHAPGWRFESAHAVGDDGSIAGIGTLHGIATVFVWGERARTLSRG